MDKQRLEALCREEFDKAKNIYIPDDLMDAVGESDNTPAFYVCYRSIRFTFHDLDDDMILGETTGIDFHAIERVPIINIVSVHKRFQDMNLEGSMVNAVERVFRRLGYEYAYASMASSDEVEFFKQMGYSVRKDDNRSLLVVRRLK